MQGYLVCRHTNIITKERLHCLLELYSTPVFTFGPTFLKKRDCFFFKQSIRIRSGPVEGQPLQCGENVTSEMCVPIKY